MTLELVWSMLNIFLNLWSIFLMKIFYKKKMKKTKILKKMNKIKIRKILKILKKGKKYFFLGIQSRLVCSRLLILCIKLVLVSK